MAPKVFLFLVLVVVLISHYGVEGRVFSKTQQEEDEDLEKQFQILNKSPLKTINAKNGDIFNCVDIHKQPALDHPLLKDHKVQTRPSSYPKGFSSKLRVEDIDIANATEILIEHLDCPEGTVPIRKTTKEDLIRSKSFFETYKPNSRAQLNAFGVPGVHAALHRSNWEGMTYHGVHAMINVANPKVENDQFSSGMMWVADSAAVSDAAIQYLQTGWAVSPELFGDHKTRFFVYSTPDPNPDLGKGCYNLQCHGFVQVDKDITIGTEFHPVSAYGGIQRYVSLTIFRDNTTGHWWLTADITHGRKNVGYWPKEIASKLHNGASYIAWGGLVRSGKNGLSPPMGNGEYPDEDYKKACSIVSMHYINEYYDMVEYQDVKGFHEYVDYPEQVCYEVQYDDNLQGWRGYSMLFGGKGSTPDRGSASCGD